MGKVSWRAIIFEPISTNCFRLDCGGHSFIEGSHSKRIGVMEKEHAYVAESKEPLQFCENVSTINAWHVADLFCSCGLKKYGCHTEETHGATDFSKLLISVLVQHQMDIRKMLVSVSLTANTFYSVFGKKLYFDIPYGAQYEVNFDGRLEISPEVAYRVAYGGLEMNHGSELIRLFIAVPARGNSCLQEFAGPAMLHYMTHLLGLEQRHQIEFKSRTFLNG